MARPVNATRRRPTWPSATAFMSAGTRIARQDGLDALDEGRAGRRQLDPAAGAVEEAHAEGRLQLGDLPAERRLGDRERLGRLPEMEPAGHLAEIDEVAQLKRELILPGHR
jgi:hypothetical protein